MWEAATETFRKCSPNHIKSGSPHAVMKKDFPCTFTVCLFCTVLCVSLCMCWTLFAEGLCTVDWALILAKQRAGLLGYLSLTATCVMFARILQYFICFHSFIFQMSHPNVLIDVNLRETGKISQENNCESWRNSLIKRITQTPWRAKHWPREWAYQKQEFR